jgi:hypothetical protein
VAKSTETDAKLTPAPSEAIRRDLVERIGGVPALRPRAPSDPRELFWWQREHPGAHPDGLLTGATPPIVRIEEFEEPPGGLFPIGVLLLTAAVYDGAFQPHRKFSKHSPSVLNCVARHARGDLGDYGAVDPSAQGAIVRSRHHCISPGFRSHNGKFRDDHGIDICVMTVFGVDGHPDPEMTLTVTLVCLEREPFARPVSTHDWRNIPTAIPGPGHFAGF